MKIISKSLFWFINTTTCVILLVLILGGTIWLVMSRQARQEAKAVAAATVLVKQKIKYQPIDVFSGCVHPDNGVVVVSVNREVFFSVKNGIVYIPKMTAWYEDKAKAMASDLPLEHHGENPYYLLEYCR